MTGEDIIAQRLLISTAIGALVPESSIKAEQMPDGTPLPWLLIRTISTIERQTLERGARVFLRERISVTVAAKSHRDRKMIMSLLPAACVGFEAARGDATSVSVLTAGAGPNVTGPGNRFERAQDFRVSFETPA